MKQFWFNALILLGTMIILSAFVLLGNRFEIFNISANILALVWIGLLGFLTVFLLARGIMYASFDNVQTIRKGGSYSYFHLPIIDIAYNRWVKDIWFKFYSNVYHGSKCSNSISKLFGISLRILPVITKKNCDTVAFRLSGYNVVLPHHYDSLRIGMRPNKEQIYHMDLFVYEYVSGKRNYYKIGTIKNEDIGSGRLTLSNEYKFVRIDINDNKGHVASHVRTLDFNVHIFYLLFPYVKKAVTKMKVFISIV